MSSDKRYYVYACYVDNEMKYVGMGKGLRYKHCVSGSSSCAELNKDFYAGKEMRVEKLHKDLNKVEADALEEDLIRNNFENLYNKVVKYQKPPSKPSVESKQNFTILASTWSLGKDKEFFDSFMMSKGLDAESVSRIEDPLIQLGLCLYIVKDTTSSPIIVIDKRKDSAVESWNREVFSHLAHPDGLWNWQSGLDMESKRY